MDDLDEAWVVGGIVGIDGDGWMLRVLFQVVDEVEIVQGDVVFERSVHVWVSMKVFKS